MVAYGGQGFALEEGVQLPLETLLYPEALIDEPVEHITSLAPVQQSAGNKKVLIFGKAKKKDQLLTVNNSEILYKNAQFVLVGM